MSDFNVADQARIMVNVLCNYAKSDSNQYAPLVRFNLKLNTYFFLGAFSFIAV